MSDFVVKEGDIKHIVFKNDDVIWYIDADNPRATELSARVPGALILSEKAVMFIRQLKGNVFTLEAKVNYLKGLVSEL